MGSIFSFSGRCGRLAYLGVAFIQLLVLGLGFAAIISAGKQPSMTVVIPFLGAMLVSVWIGLAGMVRRIRDMGWPMVLTLVGCFFLPMFSLLLLFWPGTAPDFDSSVFSDSPDPKPGKASKEKGESWMDRALAQATSGRVAAPTPGKPSTPAPRRFSGAMASAEGPRTEFGLRR